MRLTQSDSGLIVPEGAQESAVARALREWDDQLRLVPQDSTYYGQRVYKVYRYNGPDRDADFILFWGDSHGNPYPLSSAIVDAVRSLDKSSYGYAPVDPDEENRKRAEELEKRSREWGEELGREFDKRLSGKWSQPLPRSPSLAAARRRVRRRTTAPELEP